MNILVVNEQPKDVFSDHLLGKENEITRLSFSSTITLLNTTSAVHDLILLVNERIEDAVKIKKLTPATKVGVATGGTKSFAPFITFVYGENDYDYYSYRDALDFNRWLAINGERPKKLLSFKEAGRGLNSYQIVGDNSEAGAEGLDNECANFIASQADLSAHCLNWLEKWSYDISTSSFPLSFNFNRDKKIKNIILPVVNQYRGLPIFKEGDRIVFQTAFEGLTKFGATVLQISEGEMLVNFDRPVKRRELEKIICFQPQTQFLDKKIKNLSESLAWFNTLKKSYPVESPAAFLANMGIEINRNAAILPYTKPVFLSRETEKILRDKSQVEALVNCLGDRYLNFIIGPAGTGKTFVTATLVQQFVEQRKIVLLLSHSNLGVDNLLLEVAKHINHRLLFRFGNDPKVISAAAQEFHNKKRQADNYFAFPDDSPQTAEKRFLKERLDRKEALVLASTLDSYPGVTNLLELKIRPDIVIVDEASRGSFYDFLPALLAAKEKLIFIGDNRQLGNISPSPELSTHLEENTSLWPKLFYDQRLDAPAKLVACFNNGFFNSLLELGYFKPNLLNCNRRSLVAISNLVSRVFYDNQLIPGQFNPYDSGQIIFLDTKNVPKFEDKRKGTSWYNPIEATYLVEQFIRLAATHILAGGKITDLVIISPYMAQVRWLKKKLRKNLLYQPQIKTQVNPENIDAILNQLIITVDAIQGGQRKIVFISLVCSNKENRIGFNNDIRRLNVALSRAQEHLVIIGNSTPFVNCEYQDISTAFKQIISYVKAKGIYKRLKDNE